MSNTIGKLFRLTTFGESHGIAIGGIIDGCPAGITLNFDAIQQELNRRKPGQNFLTTNRKEDDKVVFLSGVFEGKTTGTPIGFQIINKDQKSKDYSEIKNVFRPSHADFTYQKKYGIRDYRGGGRSSARETANWVVAGAIAKQIIAYSLPNITINAYTSSIGSVYCIKPYQELNFSKREDNMVRCPDSDFAKQMEDLIKKTKDEGDTLGGTITCIIDNIPIGLGEPVFDKFQARLAHAMLSINTAKGFEYGAGFCSTTMKGSEHNDIFNEDGTTKSNLSGGIQGGITNGMPIYFRVAFKPVATILQEQNTITIDGKKTILKPKGRHDTCVVPRAVPIVEALSALVLLDLYLLSLQPNFNNFTS
jgi:chorismate synthase